MSNAAQLAMLAGYGSQDSIANRSKAVNTSEIKGTGPTWACIRYGDPDHDYNTCAVCYGKYRHYMSIKGVTK